MKVLKIKYRNQLSKFEKINKALEELKKEGLINDYTIYKRRFIVTKANKSSYETCWLTLEKALRTIFLPIQENETIPSLKEKVISSFSA